MISIIIPVYNEERCIRKCIESVVSQTYKELEIILVDDGSPDKCGEICDEYAHKDTRIKVIHKENGGLVSARQAGLVAAEGDYIGFVDGDDWIEADMYEKVAKVICEYSPSIIITEFYNDFKDRSCVSSQILRRAYYDKKQLINEIYPRMLFDGRFYNFGISPNCWSKVFKKALIEKFLPKVDKRIRMGEDAAFTYPSLLEAESICYIKEPFYHYIVNENSMSRAYDRKIGEILFLPYYHLKSINGSSDFDMTYQLNYYLVYLVNFLIRNEAKAINNRSKREEPDMIKRITANKDVINACGKMEMSRLPVHTRVLVKLIKYKCIAGIYLYIRMLARHL